ELRITRGGAPKPLPLPPSKKTRALLAYLVLKGRAHRRETLCGMFWDVADDPRGALRWSLSKLRALLDEPHATRVVADRERVGIELCGAEVDVLTVRRELSDARALADASSERLEQLAASFAGELMEGLDLGDFDEYQAFCVAEREQARKLRAALLEELCKRCGEQPERALPYARTWAQVDPLRFEAREAMLRLALSADLRDEAAQHYESARRTFEELGSPRAGDLARLWGALRTRSQRPAAAVMSAAANPSTNGTQPDGHGRLPAERSSHERASTVGAAPLVGRTRELQLLRDALRRVLSDRQERVVSIGGEPGIGKTRLLEALLSEARQLNATVVRGSAFEGESGRPYGPFLDGLRALLADPELRALPELGAAGSSEPSRDRLFAAVSDLIAVRAHAAPPVVIALDDVQWLDPASTELLHYLAHHSRHRPLLIVLAVRSEEASDNAALGRVLRGLRRERLLQEHVLSPLAGDEIRSLVATVGGDPEPVVAQSGGNPLFALELARMGARVGERLPDSVSDAVRERVDRLGAEAADALRWGAVLGGAFGLSRLREVMALSAEELVSALEALELSSLLVREPLREGSGGDDYRFAHEVVRRVVYADLSEPRRRLMHRRVAHALQERGELNEARVAELAHHATLARDHDLAANACCAAALRCKRLFANDEAVKLARRGLRHAERLEGLERVKRTIELLEVEQACGPTREPEAQKLRLRELGDRALAEGAAPHARRAYYMLSALNWERGAWNEAHRDALQTELVSRGGDEPQHASAMVDAARCLILLERDLPYAGAMLVEAESRAQRLGLSLGALSDARGMLLAHHGKVDLALEQFESAERLAIAERNQLLEYHVLEHRAMLETDREAFERSAAIAERMIEVGEKLREGSEAPFARTLAALARYGSSDSGLGSTGERAHGEHAHGELVAGLEALRLVDAKHRLAYALTRAALLDVAHGCAERALQRAQQARPVAELLERPSELWLSLVLALRAASELGERELADDARRALAAGDWHSVGALVRRRGSGLLVEEET
ncbi:MAG TPA: AAA family ATPase, partial [Polyangiales bacterium]|nr:AAA family ATPase [Polyangiales bacterium]